MGRKSYEELAKEAGISVEDYKAMKAAEKVASNNPAPAVKKTIRKASPKAAKKKDKIDVPTTSTGVSEEEIKETAKKFATPQKTPGSDTMMDNLSIDIASPSALDKIFIKQLRGIVISKEEMRFIVDSFYQAQRNRITCQNRVRAIEQEKDSMPDPYTCEILRHDLMMLEAREETFKKVIDAVTDATPVGRWLKSIKGVGPTIAACLIAYFDIDTCNYATHFLSYAGQNDQNRPWLGQEKSKALVNSVMEPAYYTKVDISVLENIYDALPDVNDRMEVFQNDQKVYRLDNGILAICMSRYNPFIWINNDVAEDEWVDMYDFMTPLADEDYYDNTFKYYYRPDAEIEETKEGNITIPNLNIKYIHTGDMIKVDDTTYYLCTKGGEPAESKRLTSNHIVEICAQSQWKFSHFNDAMNAKGYYEKKDVIGKCAMVPYNRTLKTLMYKISDSFVKNKNRGSLYGAIYADRKAQELRMNEEGKLAAAAAKAMASKKFVNKDMIETYSNGKLSLGHIEMRARRVAVRVFLVHVFEEMWWEHYNTEPPKFYPLQHLGHEDYIQPEIPFKSMRNASDIERLRNNQTVDNRTRNIKINFTQAELKEISARSGVKFEDIPEYSFEFGEDADVYED